MVQKGIRMELTSNKLINFKAMDFAYFTEMQTKKHLMVAVDAKALSKLQHLEPVYVLAC